MTVSAPDRVRGLDRIPIAAAAAGGTGLALAAADFFLSSTTIVIAILASVALAGALAGAALGAWGMRRHLGEVSWIGILAAGLSLPLGVFDLVVAVSGGLA